MLVGQSTAKLSAYRGLTRSSAPGAKHFGAVKGYTPQNMRESCFRLDLNPSHKRAKPDTELISA